MNDPLPRVFEIEQTQLVFLGAAPQLLDKRLAARDLRRAGSARECVHHVIERGKNRFFPANVPPQAQEAAKTSPRRSGAPRATRTSPETRCKRAGMHWTVPGANAIIALRCCKLSGRFEDFWERRSKAASSPG
jgi:hypothetical protein